MSKKLWKPHLFKPAKVLFCKIIRQESLEDCVHRANELNCINLRRVHPAILGRGKEVRWIGTIGDEYPDFCV